MAPVAVAETETTTTDETTAAEVLAIELTEAAEAIGAEAAQLAEAAHLNRATGAELTEATTGKAEVKRGQWIECTAEVLRHVRRQCHRHLAHHEAEDMAADVLERELAAALEARPPRPGCVRAERLTPTYLRLTARDWLTGREARRLAQLSTSEDEDSELSGDSGADGAAAEAAETEAEPLDCFTLYRQAAEVARRLYLVADRPVILALAAALAEADSLAEDEAETEDEAPMAARLAAAWGLSLSTWQKEAASGAAEVRRSYPDLTELVARLLPLEAAATRRRVPMAGTLTAEVEAGTELVADEDGNRCQRRRTVRRQLRRSLGAEVPARGRHRTGAQLAREADWLIAREQLPGRKAGASKAADGWRIIAAPDHWQTVREATLADHLAPLASRMVRAMAGALAATSGPRPNGTLKASGLHRQQAGTAGTGGAAATAPRKAADGWRRAYPDGAATDLGWRTVMDGRGRAASVTVHNGTALAWRRHQTVRLELHRVPGRKAARRPQEAARPPLSAEVLRLEAIEAGQWFTLAEVRRYLAASEHGRRRGGNWRPSALVPVSLDVMAAGELAATTGEVWMASEDGGAWD